MANETSSPETPSIGRNEPCPCGSGKKYKRCCGVNAAPKLSAPAWPPAAQSGDAGASAAAGAMGGGPEALLNGMDPAMLAQMSQAIQRLPKGQLQRLQGIMQKAMSGKDVAREAQDFEKTLPVEFQHLLRTFSGSPEMQKLQQQAMAGNELGMGELPAPPSASSAPMSEDDARKIVEQAAKEGRISKEEAEVLLKNAAAAAAQPVNESPAAEEEPAAEASAPAETSEPMQENPAPNTGGIGKFWRNLVGGEKK